MKCKLFFFLAVCIVACESNKKKDITSISSPDGSVLAAHYCGSCHSHVTPDKLPKNIWENSVLPEMGFRMGIFEGEQHPPDSLFEEGIAGDMVRKAGIYPSTAVLSEEKWKKIVAYYLVNAPENLELPSKKSIEMGLPHFRYHPSKFSQQPPLTTLVKFLPEKKGIVFGDGKRNISSLNFLNHKLEKQHTLFLSTSPIHYREKQDTLWLTTVGKNLLPSDTPGGILQKVYSHTNGQPFNRSRIILDGLQRPVDVSYADLNQDGREDVIVCEFGNNTGKLTWYENKGNEQYKRHILKDVPGASIVHVQDINGNGRPDITVLFGHGDEGIFLFHNLGNGQFEEEKILSFSPLNGSTYFEWIDFNNDGHLDILYTSGDNADFSPILKKHHGIYIYLNDGSFKFSQDFFYHLNGAYKAIARDFDQDGNLDIAAISFFPDYQRSPEEGFVYLQNQGDACFKAFTFPDVTDGRWIVMDANDWDQDSDLDLVLGSFVGFEPEGDTTGLYEQWVSDSPSIVVLENTIIP